jgi:hypothetical protein
MDSARPDRARGTSSRHRGRRRRRLASSPSLGLIERLSAVMPFPDLGMTGRSCSTGFWAGWPPDRRRQAVHVAARPLETDRQRTPSIGGLPTNAHRRTLSMALTMKSSRNMPLVTAMTPVRSACHARDSSVRVARPTCKALGRGSSSPPAAWNSLLSVPGNRPNAHLSRTTARLLRP